MEKIIAELEATKTDAYSFLHQDSLGVEVQAYWQGVYSNCGDTLNLLQKTPKGTIQALVACQVEDCAPDPYRINEVRTFNGKPLCEYCCENHLKFKDVVWTDLPMITLEDLTA